MLYKAQKPMFSRLNRRKRPLSGTRAPKTDSARRRRAALLQAATEIAGESRRQRGDPPVRRRLGPAVPPATPGYFFSSITELMAEALREFVCDRTAAFASLTAVLPEGRPGRLRCRLRVDAPDRRPHQRAGPDRGLPPRRRGEELRVAVADAMARVRAGGRGTLRTAGAAAPRPGPGVRRPERRFRAPAPGQPQARRRGHAA